MATHFSDSEAPVLLLADMGNTAIKLALAHDIAPVQSACITPPYTLPTTGGYTPDSLGLTLLSLLSHARVAPENLAACVASSVVPGLDPILAEACTKYLHCRTLFAPRDLPVPLTNAYERPQEVGADRLVGAWAARLRHPGIPSLLVVDFGTALTIDCVQEQSYLGGLIFPGPETALQGLARGAAKLPQVNLHIEDTEPSPGKSTVTSIQHGIVFGFVSLVEGLCQRLAGTMPQPLRVVGTGGFAASIARVSSVFDEVASSLVLEGLLHLFANSEKMATSQRNCIL